MVPQPFAERSYSGKFNLRVGESLRRARHQRRLGWPEPQPVSPPEAQRPPERSGSLWRAGERS
ncbi:toxin-antitoxin system HicB family antitoxin [Micromonospora sp. NPDC000663]|uniref:toxin-antitoxin system HicB family antitoxin n=1 Tax=Micromonospora sp. NPDC000663 TaxID=3364218 RepID=UPI0036A4DFE1